MMSGRAARSAVLSAAVGAPVPPRAATTLFENSLGMIAVGISVVMALFGFVWLRKIMRIEV
jgi:Flp pilus assembly protein TadB